MGDNGKQFSARLHALALPLIAYIIDSMIIGIPVYIIWNFVLLSLIWGGAWWLIGYGS